MLNRKVDGCLPQRRFQSDAGEENGHLEYVSEQPHIVKHNIISNFLVIIQLGDGDSVLPTYMSYAP